MKNLGLGVGLRSQHYDYLMHHDPQVDWFEVISENYMEDFGFARHVLARMRSQKPVVLHGVSLSIGSTDPLDINYLQKLKALAEFVQPAWISDHLCWTGVGNVNTHDLLPMPLTEESLSHVSERVLRVQDFLGVQLVLENPSTYLQFKVSTIPEWEFLSALVSRTDCGLLLDVNNVFVSATNHRFDAEHYIRSIPHRSVVQIHIAGPTDCGSYLMDTHDKPVPSRVWELYKLAQELTGGVSTLLEWDAHIPEYPQLVEELHKSKEALLGRIPQTPIYAAGEHPVSNPISFQFAHPHE